MHGAAVSVAKAQHRPLDRGDVPHVPAAPPRRLAHRRPRRPPGLRPRLATRTSPDPKTTRTTRRSLPTLPLDRRPLLLGSHPPAPTRQHRARTPLTSPPTPTNQGGHMPANLPEVISRYFERDTDRDIDSS